MKRGKDDEKVMGPMFPRLHVNDTEKGGPRAPPRNKMALYEQFTIPSQRFNRSEMMPLNHNNNANFLPPASSSQVPPSRHSMEKPRSCHLDPSTILAPFGHKQNPNEDNLSVPVSVCSKTGQDSVKYHNHVEGKLSSWSHNYSIKLNTATHEDPKQIGAMGVNARQNSKCENADNAKGIVTGRNLDEAAMYDYSRLQRPDPRPQPEQRSDPQPGSIRSILLGTESVDRSHEDSSMSLRKFPSVLINLDDDINDTEFHEDKTCGSSGINNQDREDNASETSMVDYVSGVDISPDDVVGMIGQKHFWKARRAIASQQRVFAVQVFELHRLIKVQRLITESPHLSVEDSAYLHKPTKSASVKKLPQEYIVTSNIPKHKSEKPNNKMECSAENIPEKVSLSSIQNGTWPLNYRTFDGNTPLTPISNEQPNMGSWVFPQPQGHQWLVPVMSPTEGLVYKAYPGPGFTSPICGGCGPPGPATAMGNFLAPAYGVPASHHQYQGMGVPTYVLPPGPHGYFPTYGMAVVNSPMPVHGFEQVHQFPTEGPLHSLSGGGSADLDIQHQNSNNLPVQKSVPNTDGLKSNMPQESGLQVRTASSPTERAECGLENTKEGSSVPPVFPTSAVTEVCSSSLRHQESNQTPVVIRVVPHNGGSATESAAARIFLSIQKERKE